MPDPEEAFAIVTILRGLTLYVSRAADGDWTRGGVTARHTELTVLGIYNHASDRPDLLLTPRSWQVSPAHTDKPAVVVHIHERGLFGSHSRMHLYLEPTQPTGDPLPGWYAHGGNFAGTSDGRFAEELEPLLGYRLPGPLPVHDHRVDPSAQQWP